MRRTYTLIALMNLALFMMMRIWVMPHLIWGKPYVFSLYVIAFALQANWVFTGTYVLWDLHEERKESK